MDTRAPALWLVPLLVPLLALTTVVGCEKRETKHDVYMRAMQLEGEAERGDCKLAYDSSAAAHVLDGDQVQSCLNRLEEALELYERAAAMGLKDIDFINARDRALQRKKKLEGMLSMVRKMEEPAYEPPKLPD